MLEDLHYRKIKNDLIQKIFNGIYQDGAAIPSERDLSEEYHVSRDTVRKALDILEEEKIIQRKIGRGTVVSLNRQSYCGNLDIIALVAPAQREFFGLFIEQFQKIADRNNSLVVFVQQSECDSMESTLFRLLQKNIHNVVLWLDYEVISNQCLRLLRGLGMNIVLFDTIVKTPYADCVCLDNQDAILSLYRYVAGKKTKGIAYINRETLKSSSHKERVHAFQKVFPTGVVWSAPWDWNSTWDYKNYYDIFTNNFIFDHLSPTDRPGAVICSDGAMGLAIKKALNQQEISDVLLVTIDDFPELNELGVTVYRQPYHLFAAQIFECLKEQNVNSADWTAVTYRIKGELIIRG